jgi:hypothetical protein
MSAFPQLDVLPIAPVYAQAAPNENLSLGRTRLRFSHGDKVYDEEADAILSFRPRARLEFVIPPGSSASNRGLDLALDGWKGKLHLGPGGEAVDPY